MKPNSYFPHINNEMHAENVAISDIAAKVSTPFYCYSSSAIEASYLAYKAAFDQIENIAGSNGNTQEESLICYAVKANDNQAVLSTLAKLGSGADVVSMGEIRRAISAGIPANKIVYSGVAKAAVEIKYALELGIFQFNVESEPELELISQIATQLKTTASIAFRINPDVCAQTHAKISTGKAENKFGVPISKARIAYKRAAELPGIKVQGVDVHIGSQLTLLEPFSQAYRRIAELVVDLREDGHDINVIDVGGGLGITYKDEVLPTKQDYVTVINKELGQLGCRIVIEPGRSLLCNAGILVSSVVFVKEGEERQFLILDAGMNDLIRPSMYEAYHQIHSVNRDKERNELTTYDVVGPVCETGDTFAKARQVHHSKQGDLIAIMSTGAYGAVMSSTYNTRMLAPEVMVKDDQFAIIRQRPDYETVINTDVVPDWI